MKNQWKTVKLGFLLFALPLVATAAASAHSWIVDSSPILIESSVAVVANSAIGNSRVHTVALNRNGAIEGRIASFDSETKGTTGLEGLKVFFIQNGAVVKESVTGSGGSFLVEGIAEGAYSFVATGDSGFAAYGIRVVADESGTYDNVMEAAAVSPRFDVIRRILDNELPKSVANEILENSSVAKSNDVQVAGSNRIALEGGVLFGRVVPLDGSSNPVVGTNVHIIQNSREVAKANADKDGNFSIEGLEPGVYDFVAAGRSGFAAVSFEAVGSVENVEVDSDDFNLPASGPVFVQDPAVVGVNVGSLPAVLEIRLTAPQDGEVVGDQLDDDDRGAFFDDGIVYDGMPIEFASDSVACGGAGGSVGAPVQGCGPGYGGGGLGRLALLGGLAVGITALATDGSGGGGGGANGNGDPGPVSPVMP